VSDGAVASGAKPEAPRLTIGSDTLSSLASDYATGMTSIRGRRVQRLVKREFAGAEYVFIVQTSSGMPAVLGVSASGAACCATDGTGKQASVFKWLHGSSEALETQFDLLKDSLPVLGTRFLPLTALRGDAAPKVRGSVPPRARALVSMALHALA
jgi:hypothetical protein